MLPTFKETLKKTTSRCPVCKLPAPAEVWKTKGTPAKVYLSRTCAEHGESTACISSDARFHWLAKGDPANSCGAACACSSDPAGLPGTLGRNADAKDPSVEILSTCLALIEIVDSCNLPAPPASPSHPSEPRKLKAHPLEELTARIEGVLERKGGIEILQLSGGDPPCILSFSNSSIGSKPRTESTTPSSTPTGCALPKKMIFLMQVGKRARQGHFQLYLQFDGLQEAGQRALREPISGGEDGDGALSGRKNSRHSCHDGDAGQPRPTLGDHRLRAHGTAGASLSSLSSLSGRTPNDTGERLNTADIISSCVKIAPAN